ncbi:2-hydroxymuconate semialdehyde hydrolase [Solimonas aquatica]|uniref:2-hydroxymuconate semialdehyde hydrolase n=1 Tax=Solimonas aquatica TaxID=489703 RepID=A0A1H9BLE4_9GAMM|nr:alpha/beta fold hydrolase [Solimonas aquatica]SEP89343.1 2-hydroxymuconate semialdehyde hydrolase [Solimonas aquatica]
MLDVAPGPQASPAESSPELGKSVLAAGLKTNLHDLGSGHPVVLIHGSGPGVSAYANWRLCMPELARSFRVVAPDLVGFGFTERPQGISYTMDAWVQHLLGVLDALGIERAHLVGNSFGGALALALATRHPQRVARLVLMGSVGVRFKITAELDAVWGYEPSLPAMRKLIGMFSADRHHADEELARLRYEASIRPGFQESYAAMFPAPRQRWVDAMASPEEAVRALPHETLIIHGREDRVIPLSNAYRLLELIPQAQMHVFGRCGHWTQIEQAARFSRLLLDFFGEAQPAKT